MRSARHEAPRRCPRLAIRQDLFSTACFG